MNSEVDRLLDLAAQLPAAERAAFLDRECPDPEVRAEVETLLAYATGGETLFESAVGAVAASLALSREPAPGDMLGAYRIVSLIGRGGMGAVYLAERADGAFTQQVAAKVVQSADAGLLLDRFRQERRILALLDHPNIARILDGGQTPAGLPYFVMEYVPGQPIDRFCDAGKLDLRSRLRLFLEVCDAVQHAHQNLIVHRDLTPANILVTESGQPKLLDFGIAKVLDPARLDSASTRMLTPGYASPEQIRGDPITTAADIYSLGAVLYKLVAGRAPHVVEDMAPLAAVEAILDRAVPAASSLRPGVPRDVDAILGKALHKDSARRYRSVAGLAADIGRFLDYQPVSARPDTVLYRVSRFVRRHRTTVALAAAAFAATVAGLAGTIIQARAAKAQRDFALSQLGRAEAINELNSFILSDAAPSGKPFTVNELLGRAEEMIGRRRTSDAENRVQLLVSIGRQYWSQDEDARAARVLQEAYRLSRAVTERSTRAKASCALASLLARGNDVHQPEALFQEGLGELPSRPQYALDRIFCLSCGAEVAREAGAAQLAVARAEEARGVLRQAVLRPEALELSVAMNLAESYRQAGRYREAGTAFEEVWARMSALGRDNTQSAGTLFNNWGLTFLESGRPLEAERLLRRAIALSGIGEAQQGVSPMLLVNYGQVLRRLGRTAEAADYAERGYERARQAGDEVVIGFALNLRAYVYRERGELGRAGAVLDELAGRWKNSAHVRFAVLRSQQSLLAQARGELRSAVRLQEEAVGLAQKSMSDGKSGSGFLAEFLVRESGIELELGGGVDAAAAAARAVNLLRSSTEPGTPSDHLGRAYLALAQALDALQKHPEARAAARTALENLESALGRDHPDTRSARRLATP